MVGWEELDGTLTALSQKAEAIIQQGLSNRHLLLIDVIEPVHQIFLQFKREHIQTLEAVTTLIRSGEPGRVAAYDYLQQRQFTDAEVWRVLIAADYAILPQDKILEDYSSFVRMLVSVVLMAVGPRDGEGGSDTLEYALLNTDGRSKEETLQRIQELHQWFAQYCAQIKDEYRNLYRLCTGGREPPPTLA